LGELARIKQNDFKETFSRQGAKKKDLLFLRAWRAWRPFGVAQDMLCASHLFPIPGSMFG
jgi:hypothetical protein